MTISYSTIIYWLDQAFGTRLVMSKIENNYTIVIFHHGEDYGQETEYTTKGSKMGIDKGKRGLKEPKVASIRMWICLNIWIS